MYLKGLHLQSASLVYCLFCLFAVLLSVREGQRDDEMSVGKGLTDAPGTKPKTQIRSVKKLVQ